MQRTTLLLDDGAAALSRYLLMQVAVNACFGTIVAAGLWQIGVPSPLLWGLCVFVLRFVPYIGVPLGALAPALLAASVDPGWSRALETVTLFLVGEVITGQAIEPWLYGKCTGLSPIAIVVSASFWTALWGPVGLLLSNPLTMCLVVLGRHIEHLKFLDVLLGDRPPLGMGEALYLRMLGDDPDEAAAEAESFIEQNSLGSYYSEVALKALKLADTDIGRGLLDAERADKITENTRALIQNLSNLSTSVSADDIHNSKAVGPGKNHEPVFCIGGHGPADEAAALLLIHLLDEVGVSAELIRVDEVRASETRDFSRAKVICVCYLESGNAVRAVYLLRRIRRLAPRATHLAAFWDAKSAAALSNQLGCTVLVTLDEAVKAIEEACTETSPRAREKRSSTSAVPGLSLTS